MLVVSLSAIRTAGRAFLGPNIPNWISVRLYGLYVPYLILETRSFTAGLKQVANSLQNPARPELIPSGVLAMTRGGKDL